jgi:hypothetical protein
MKRGVTIIELMTYAFVVSILLAGMLACYKSYREFYAGAVGSYLISSEFEPGLRALRRELKETALVSLRAYPNKLVSSARPGLSFISGRDWDRPTQLNISPHGAPEWDKHVFYTMDERGIVTRWEKKIDPLIYMPVASTDLPQSVEGRHTKTMFKGMTGIQVSFLSYAENGDELLTSENPYLNPAPEQTRIVQVDLKGTNGSSDSFWVHFRVAPRH